ncbi:DUF1570 domain-containing protein [Mycobacterium sp. URHB0021]
MCWCFDGGHTLISKARTVATESVHQNALACPIRSRLASSMRWVTSGSVGATAQSWPSWMSMTAAWSTPSMSLTADAVTRPRAAAPSSLAVMKFGLNASQKLH